MFGLRGLAKNVIGGGNNDECVGERQQRVSYHGNMEAMFA